MLQKITAQCKCLKRAIKDLSQESIESTDTVVNVQRNFLSEINLVGKLSTLLKSKSISEPNIHYAANYDDICGSWPLPDHPSFKQYSDGTIKPILCAWKFITVQDMQRIKLSLFEKEVIQSIFENRISENFIFNHKSKELYLNLAWEIFKRMRDDGFSAKGISSVLGLFYLTHRFFLTNSWRSAFDTYIFFQKGLDLHVYLKLPESDMIFNLFEYDKILEMLRSLYITKLELIRLVCIPQYNVIFNLKNCNRSKYHQL